jgi:hypothetical protein
VRCLHGRPAPQRLRAPQPPPAGDPACGGAPLAELAALLRKEQCNSYGIMAAPGPAGERRLRGGGIYPRCSLVNHECIPNAARFDAFDAPAQPGVCCSGGASESSGGGSGGYPVSTAVTIRAMHALPAGTEVVQSYFPLNWSLPERAAQARSVYGFDCACPRCLTEVTPEWAALTGGSGSGSEWETDSGDGDGDDGMEHDASSEGGGGGREEEAAPHGGGANGCANGSGGGGAAGGASSSGGGGGREALDPTYLQLFMLKYVCPREACFGTMAAVQGAPACECNVCGHRRSEAEFLAELERE